MVSTKHDYLARCRAGIARYKFFDQAPTTELLREAQVRCGELRLPIPRDDKGDILPYPTTKSKADIFTLEQYKEIDNHALRAPSSLQSAELTDLVKYLLKPAHNDVAKVRVIFRWISGQDLLRYKHIPGAPRDSAAMYLNELKQNKGSYESLFRQMCKYAGIPCEKITGYAKGVSYKVGEDVLENARNTWNAVLVDSNWRLIDMQWASRQVVTQDQGEWELIDDGTGAKPAKSDDSDVSYDIYAYEEFYFLCDPEEFIYSHFPDEEAWQLLARPVSFAEFQKIAYLRSKFFELHLTVISHPWCVLQAISGEANLDLGYLSETMKFSYNLYRSTKVEHKQIQANYDMDKFLFLDAIPDEKVLSMEIFFPTTGKFKAELFGRDMTESDTVLKWLCTYVFYCESPKTDCRPLPQNPRKEWGPGSDTISMGMEPLTHKRGKINVDDGEVEVKFALKEDRDFLHKLTTEDNQTLDNYTVHRIENGEVIFNARVPGKGQYMLSIMAKEDDQDGSYPNVCNYLLRCEEEFPPLEPFPEIPNGELGPTDEFKKLNLELLDGCQSMITVDKSGQTQFKMKIPKDVEFFAKLGLQTPTGVEDKSEFVSWYRDGDIVTFDLRFAQKGSYRFNLFAKPSGQPGGFPRAFSSIIEVPIPMMVAMSFPEKYAGWTDDCKLIEPFNKDIAAKENIEFAAVVPKAKAVAVVGDEWTQLKKDNDGIWRNSVYTIEEGKPMFLSAKFDAEGNSFSHLLKYNVVPKSKIEEMAREQSRAHHEADKEYQERQRMKEELKKKGEEKRKQEAVDKKRRMELQVMEDGERKQIEERFDFEDSGKGDTATAKRLEEERKQREEDRKKKVEAIKQRDEELSKKREFPRSAASDSWKSRGSKSPDDLRKELKTALRSKSRDSLEKIITECEQYSYPELGSELREARDTLESLGGGRGVDKSSDVLRDQLKTAMKQNDKAALQRAIEEAEASGLPELGYDLRKARDALDKLGGGRGGAKTVESMREKLAEALSQNDPRELEDVLEECLASGHEELLPEIEKARQTLAPMGQGAWQDIYMVSKTPLSLHEQIRQAIDTNNVEDMCKCIYECEISEYPELGTDVREAREILIQQGRIDEGCKSSDILRDQLMEAVNKKDARILRQIINSCVSAGLKDLDSDIQQARTSLYTMEAKQGGTKSPESLREELQSAITQKSRVNLERVITECESAGYPELSFLVSDARDTLDYLGGGRGGCKKLEKLREKLMSNVRQNNRHALEQCIDECVSVGHCELWPDIEFVRENIDSLLNRPDRGFVFYGSSSSGMVPRSYGTTGYTEVVYDVYQTGSTTEFTIEQYSEGVMSPGSSDSPDSLASPMKIDRMGPGRITGEHTIIAEVTPAAYQTMGSFERDHFAVTKSPDVLRQHLKMAVQENDQPNLEKVIIECEKAEYPELSCDLLDARETFKKLGGGYGGNRTPEILRQHLKEVVEEKDQRKLNKVIKMCVSAGLPGMEADIQKARETLHILRGGKEGLKSPKDILERLQNAVKRKDQPELENAIIEAEEACYPELSYDLLEARDTLESMGFGRGGNRHPDLMRDKLELAKRQNDRETLERLTDECIASGHLELIPDIQNARRTLDLWDGGRGVISPGFISPECPGSPGSPGSPLRRSGKMVKIEGEQIGFPESVSGFYHRMTGGIKEFFRGGKSPDTLREELKLATEQKDRPSLEKLIEEGEHVEYPELAYEMREARLTLKELGGGYGGNTTPESLRKKLNEAIKEEDAKYLDKTIKECLASGFPELDSDINQARELLFKLKGHTGGYKSSKEIRENLLSAIKQKNRPHLEKIILESEEAGYPELSRNLLEARDTLENMGFGRGGSQTPDSLRLKLESAKRENNVEALEMVIDECVSSGHPELLPDIQQARNILDFMETGREGFISPGSMRPMFRGSGKVTFGDQHFPSEMMSADMSQIGGFSYPFSGERGDMTIILKSPDDMKKQLQTAIQLKDKPTLECLILECETSDYPELAYELRDARETLNKLGGGYGGSVNPENVREKLKTSIRENDKKSLDAAIKESISLGLPGLNADIQEAREAFYKLEGGSGDLKSPDALRDQLKAAIKNKSQPELEKVILECEEAGYPELSLDLRLARDSLDSMGFGRGGTMTPENLRLKLDTAKKQNDPEVLEKVIAECVSSGHPELMPEIQEARFRMKPVMEGGKGFRPFPGFHVKVSSRRLFPTGQQQSDVKDLSPDTLGEQLRLAVKNNDRPTLEKLIQMSEEAQYPELGLDICEAREALNRLGGGYGGSVNPENVRQQLKTAIKSKDKKDLDAITKQTISLGLPGLEAEVQEARDILYKLEGGKGGLKAPDSLRGQLRTAIQNKNRPELEKAILECEEAGYPELSLELRQARDTLDAMGFGRGGTMTPDTLRQKLDAAKTQNDPDVLEKVIAECVSSGHPELMSDIQEARYTLQSAGVDRSGGIITPGSPRSIIKRPEIPDIGRMSGDSTVYPETTLNVSQSRCDPLTSQPGQRDPLPEIKSPEMLRDQLRLAMEEKDQDNLDQLIFECENSRYPELGLEIRQARDVLTELGGGRGGSRSPELLREHLREAVRYKDKKILSDMIKDYVSLGLPELDADIQQAREFLARIQDGRGAVKSPQDISEQLRSAIKQKSRPQLEKAILECEEAGYPELSLELRQAKDILDGMGFSRGGSKSPESLRERLETARKRKDKEGLEKALEDCIASGHPQLQSDIQQTQQFLDSMSSIRGGLLPPGSPRSPGSPHSPRSPYSTQSARSPHSPRSSQVPRSPQSPCSPKGGVRRQVRPNVGQQSPMESGLTQQITPTMYRPREGPQPTIDTLKDTSNRAMSVETLRNDLRSVIKKEDRANLERLIQECERAEYPELGYDLQDARSMLKRMSGSYGGTKSPDYYRDLLKQANNQRDKRNLERAIKQSVASGFSILESDIHRARNTLNLLEGGVGGIKPSKDLRDRLRNAIRQKSRPQLEKAIAECEEAGYPELSRDLREARDTLESMGFGRGGVKTPESLREKLDTARRNNDREMFEKAVDDCISSGYPELVSEISQTRKGHEGQRGISVRFPRSKSPDTLRSELKAAIQQKDAPTLNKVIAECENAKYPELCHQLREARQVHKQLCGKPGGSLNPETLREQLKDATRQKDANLLYKSIKICLASGFPELDADINRARDNLDIIDGGQGGMPCSETLREQLRNACQNKNRTKLERAIVECEAAAYPELNNQLRESRMCLESLGFGRGGSLTPESLRIKLDTAKRQNDRQALERAIDECVMAGHPELTTDIQNAREILDYMDDYDGAPMAPGSPWPSMKSPEMFGKHPGQLPSELRVVPEMAPRVFESRRGIAFGRPGARPADILDKELKRAIHQKDQTILEKLIAECEGAEYPQLGHTLRSSRLILKQMGGGNGGVQSPDYFRDQLRNAVSQSNINKLDRVIKQSVAVGFPELDSDLQKARETLYTLQGGQGGLKSPDTMREQLRLAIAKKDTKALERVILDSEATGYPELAFDLREARDTLEGLTGSRGGNKTPKLLHEKLEAAKGKGDFDELERVIDECLVSGQPEIVPEVVKARELFACRQDYPRGSVSPDNLRDKLKRAMKLKDKQALEKAIEECVASGHPELLADVQQARDTLDSLGGGRRASKPTDVLRDQLKAAMKSKHPASLERAIAEAEASKDPQLIADVQSAKKMLDAVWPARAGSPEEVRKLRAKLESAMRRDDTVEMQRIMIEIEQKNLSDYLTVEVGDARSRLQGQQGHIQPDPEAHLTRTEASVDARSAARFGQYSQYGTMSHDLLIAALVVIGENERRLGNWKNFQHFFDMAQADGSTRHILGMDIENIYQDLSARADEILTRHSTDEVHLLNRSGHMSYSWSRLMNQQMSAHFNSFSSSTAGGAQMSRTSSSSSFAESTAHMSQTSRTEFQTFGGSRGTTHTSEGPTTTTYQYSQGSRRDGQNGNTGFTSYSSSSKRRF